MENVPYLLALLACPVGMGLMMWLMLRGQHGQHGAQGQAPSAPAPAGAASAPAGSGGAAPEALDDARLDGLRARLADLESQQAAIGAEIERLAGEERPVGEPSAQR